MGFKLVRVDATEPCKIPLAVGTHFIGRGKFLDCHDHRVSRNHGQLEVTDDSVRIIALHQNPCFFRRKCSQNTNILPQNEFIELSNGDQFGLVPESYWYELIYCIESLVPPCGDYTAKPVKIEKSTDAEPSVSGSSSNTSQIDIENTERIHPSILQDTESTFMDTDLQTDMPSTSPYKRSHSGDSTNTVVKKFKTEPQNSCVRNLHTNNQNGGVNNENQGVSNESRGINNETQEDSNKNRVVDSENQAVNSESQPINNESQAVNSESQVVNSEARAANSESQAVNSESQATNSESQATNSESQAVNSNQGNVGTSIEDNIPDEGIQETDEVNTSKSEKEIGTTLATVKTEPCSQDAVNTESNSATVKTEVNNETVKTEPSNSNVKIEPNVNPGPSNNQPGDASAAGAADKAAAGAAAPTPPPPAAGRPREKCMYGAQCYRVNPVHKAQFSHPGDPDWAERAPCRWGAACRDIRPAHWRDRDHPPRRDPRRPGHGIRVVQRHGNIFYINANSVHFYDDHFQVQDSDGESVDYDYEF